MNYKVSIITPSYNRAHIIHETANSILGQIYTNWEWIIVDDGSTDNSWDVVNEYAERDDRIKVFKRLRDPKGACTCRNIAIDKSSGDLLIFLDTDDLLASFCLKQRVEAFLQNPQADFLIFPMLLFKKNPNDLGLLWNIDSIQDDVDRILMGDPICQGTGTIWKKESFIKMGMWDESLHLWQDIDLHLRSLLSGVIYEKRMDLKPDVFLRISDVSLSRTGYHSLPKLRSRIDVLCKIITLVNEGNKQNLYSKGLRYMFKDIFISAVNSNHFKEAKYLLKLEKHWQLFYKHERMLFSVRMALRRSRLDRIANLRRAIDLKIDKLCIRDNAKIGRIHYSGNIEI